MHVFKHPKYYEAFRQRAKEAQRIAKQQAASDKQQAIDETVPHCDIEEATSSKQHKRQASKILDPKDQASSESSSNKR